MVIRKLRLARTVPALHWLSVCTPNADNKAGAALATFGTWWIARRNRLLWIVAILFVSTVPLYAQRQQQNVAKLKDDARNLVGIIGSDNAKIQTYCQIEDLSEQLIEAAQEEDRKKAKALERKIAELNKKMGPEFAAVVDIEKHVDLDSRDGQEIASIVASLGESCGEK